MRLATRTSILALLATGVGFAAAPALAQPNPPAILMPMDPGMMPAAPGAPAMAVPAEPPAVAAPAEPATSPYEARLQALHQHLEALQGQAGVDVFREGLDHAFGMGPMGEGIAAGIAPAIRSADADDDGALSQEEFLAAATALFERADRDDDGSLSAEEIRGVMERIHGMHGDGGGDRTTIIIINPGRQAAPAQPRMMPLPPGFQHFFRGMPTPQIVPLPPGFGGGREFRGPQGGGPGMQGMPDEWFTTPVPAPGRDDWQSQPSAPQSPGVWTMPMPDGGGYWSMPAPDQGGTWSAPAQPQRRR